VPGSDKPILQMLGPGLITGASDDDPSGIGTYSQAGAQFGFGMLWVILFTYPLMCAIQEISARIGRTSGRGLAANMRRFFPRWFAFPVVALLLAANILNLGADLGAMAAAAKLLIGGPALLYVVGFAIVSFLGAAFFRYKQYSNVLKWLSMILFAYLVVPFLVKVPWAEAIRHTVVPEIHYEGGFIALLVGIFGTTISPYLFFWQASGEAEESRIDPESSPLRTSPEQAPAELNRIRIDTLIGMGVSNVVAWFIILSAAVTLFISGHHDIQSASDAASALKPLGGQLATLLFSVGIIGTGLLAVPVLAGSAAYALGEELKARVGIDFSPKRAPIFYTVMGVATALGVALNFSPINPIKALVWSAVLNGIVAVPVMVAMMLMVRDERIMGPLKERGPVLYGFGWLATGVMGLAVVAMFLTMGK